MDEFICEKSILINIRLPILGTDKNLRKAKRLGMKEHEFNVWFLYWGRYVLCKSFMVQIRSTRFAKMSVFGINGVTVWTGSGRVLLGRTW